MPRPFRFWLEFYMGRIHGLVWVSVALWTAGCAGSESSKTVGTWTSTVIFEAGTKLGGCAVGDVDASHPGLEVVVCGGNGAVYVLRHTPERWVQELVAEFPGEMIQVAVGDVDPASPGDEIVCVGSAAGDEDSGAGGVAFLIRRQGLGFEHRVICQDGELLHAVAVVDLIPDRAGREILVAGYSGRARLIGWEPDGPKELGQVGFEGRAKGASEGLGGVVLVCDNGSLRHVVLAGASGLAERELQRFPDALARVTADGRSVVCCGNDGILRIFEDGKAEEVLRAPQRLRGAVRADLMPERPGTELATAGYDGAVTVAFRGAERGGYETTLAARDSDRLHHLAFGVLPEVGPALVAVGYSGRVLAVSYRPAN